MTSASRPALLWIGADAPALQDTLAHSHRLLSLTEAESLLADDAARIDVVATGAGAAQALALAARHPAAIGCLVLLAPALDAGALAPVTTPALVLVGAADAAGTTAGRALKAALPRCRLTYVWGAGADLAGDQSGRAIPIVSDFLARGEAFLVRPSG